MPPVQTDATAQRNRRRSRKRLRRPHPPSAVASQPEGANRAQLEEQLSAARVTARQQIVAGQRQAALDALVRGLALDATDPELNGLVDDLTRVARRTATEARTAAVLRGASPRSSAEFRDGQAREREADSLLRAGDRVPGIRVLWAAAALYNKAPRRDRSECVRRATAGAGATAPSIRSNRRPLSPGSQSISTSPAPELLKPPAPATMPAPATAPPPPPKPEPPPAPRDPRRILARQISSRSARRFAVTRRRIRV